MSALQILIIVLLIANVAITSIMLYRNYNKKEKYNLPPSKQITWADGFGGYGTTNEFKTFSGCNCVGAALKNNQNMTNDKQLYENNQYQHY